MPRILIVECMQEISSFNPVPSGYENFHVERGEEIYAQRGRNTAIGGALAVFEARQDIDDRPASPRAPAAPACCRPQAGAALGRDSSRRSREGSDGVDGVYFSLHGAMGAEGELDPEGYLLTKPPHRRPTSPIVISLDLHGILTDRMLRQIDGLAIYHTYPHVDFADTGAACRAASPAGYRRAGEAGPSSRGSSMPALVRGDELITKTGCYGDLIRECQRLERDGTRDGRRHHDRQPLHRRARTVQPGPRHDRRRRGDGRAGGRCGSRRNSGLCASACRASSSRSSARSRRPAPIEGPVIFTDAADATSSGATGDSNMIIEGAARGGLSKSACWRRSSTRQLPPRRTRPASAPTIEVDARRQHRPGALLADAGHGARFKLLSDGRSRLETMKIGARRRADRGARRSKTSPSSSSAARSACSTVRCTIANGLDPARLRPDRREVAAHRAPHVRRLGGEELQHRRARRNLGQPEEPRPHRSAPDPCIRSTTASPSSRGPQSTGADYRTARVGKASLTARERRRKACPPSS